MEALERKCGSMRGLTTHLVASAAIRRHGSIPTCSLLAGRRLLPDTLQIRAVHGKELIFVNISGLLSHSYLAYI